MSNEIRDPVYGGGGSSRKNFWKLKEGNNIYRILPAFGKLAEGQYPKWNQFYAVHWGYQNTQGKNKPFASPEKINFKTKIVEVRDPARERIKKLEAVRDQAKQEGNKAVLDQTVELLKTYRVDKKYYVNAMALDGSIGVLALPYKALKSLEGHIKTLYEQGANPIGIQNGRVFNFRRSGMNFDTTYEVSVHQEDVEIPGHGRLKKDVISNLSEEVLNRMKSEAVDLSTLYKTPTTEEINIIMSGPAGVDQVLGTSRDAEPDSDEAPQAAAPQAAAPTPTPTAAPAAQPTPAAPPIAAQAAAQVSNEEFLKQMGL